MKTLLRIQELDLKIERCRQRETEIPRQKSKFDVHRKRLADELAQRQEQVRNLQLEQKESEGAIELRNAQIAKYEIQLLAVKKNEEYKALLHEIELEKKKIAQLEERILTIMVEREEGQQRLAEDEKRIAAEQQGIDSECAAIDAELAEAVKVREELETSRKPLEDEIESRLLRQYHRLRSNKRTGAVIVPISGDACSGCHMQVLPQIVNDVLANEEVRACNHCGRLLYAPQNFPRDTEIIKESVG